MAKKLDEPHKQAGLLLKAELKRRGLSPREFANLLNQEFPSTVTNWFRRGLPPSEVDRVAVALGWSRDDLLGEGPPTVKASAAAIADPALASITPDELQVIKDLRIILDDVRVEIRAQLEQAARVARQYEQRFGKSRADNMSVIRAISPAPRLTEGEIAKSGEARKTALRKSNEKREPK